MEIQQVKNDLYNLRKTIHTVAVTLEARKRQIERLEGLLCLPDSPEKSAEVEKMQYLIELLSVASVSNMEQRYMTAISKLELIDKTIILDWLVNGKPHWKIGMDLGYSKSRITAKINKIYIQITKTI